jgi:Cu/Ag efflux pump CusA
MNFSAWAIRNPVAPIVAFVLLMVMGWQAFNRLPITRFPNIDVPLVSVSVVQPGAAPAEMEAQITKEIEDAVAGIAGVKNIISSVSDGLSTTAVEFRMEVPTDKAVQDVKDAVDRIRSDLPGGIEAPVVSRIDVEGQAIMTFAVGSADMSLEELSWFVDDRIKRALQGRPGIGRIDRYGGADREIRIELDPLRLDSFGITAAAVNAQLRATNANLGSGRTELGGSEQAIRVLGDAAGVERLAATTIALPTGRFVRLADLGTVSDSYEEPRSFSRLDGVPRQGRLRGQRRRNRRPHARHHPHRQSRGRDPHGRRHGVLYPGQLRIGAAHPDRRRGAGGSGGVPVPAQLARHADFRRGAAPVGGADLLGDGAPGLLAQPCQRSSRSRTSPDTSAWARPPTGRRSRRPTKSAWR